MVKKMSALIGLVVVIYLITHLMGLTKLPVFADEAIYIRWSQLMIDDWSQYAFFPLNDGKTPLQMWLMVPFQFLFDDQLLAGRFLSVVVGLLQVLAVGWLTKLLGGKDKTAVLAMVLTTVLPFWYFHHRMALTDPLLTLFISLTIAALIKAQISFANSGLSKYLRSPAVWWSMAAGLFFGLALWTKLPAILMIPALPLYIFLTPRKKTDNTFGQTYFWRLSLISVSILVGLMIFGFLKLNPAFGQLFNRGNDFLFPWTEVILEGKWQQTIQNIPSYINYFGWYLSWPVILLVIAGLFTKQNQRAQFILFLSAAAFLGPIALLGKVVYPRYLLPASLFFTLSAALSFEYYVDRFVNHSQQLYQKVLASLILVFMLAQTLGLAGMFMYASIFDPDTTPFVAADREQYLTEWSSGHGIPEVVAYLKQRSQTESLAVATEGSFGTLPDGILLYFHRQNVENLYVEGIGYPVKAIQGKYLERALDYDRQLLIVNSHRMEIPLDDLKLEFEVCRPYNAPCLQVWDISQSSALTNPVSESSDRL